MNMNIATRMLLRLVITILCPLFMAEAASAQMVLYPDLLGSNPTDSQVGVLREKGRKGLQFHFKYQDGANLDSNAGFPLSLPGGSAVTLKLGADPPLNCAAGNNPGPGACSNRIIDGPDVDGALDTVEILYNGDFPANTSVQFSVTGARSSTMIDQNADPSIVTFTTGNLAPRATASIEIVFDISGSMGLPAVPAGPVTRMDALKTAAQSFFDLLEDFAMIGDKIGSVYFSTTANPFDPTPGGTNLEPAHDITQVNSIEADLLGRLPTSSTAIGAGLQAANTSGFTADPSPNMTRYVLLFSDGEQNVPPNVGVAAGNVQVGGVNYAPGVKVCPVTAGRMIAPGFALQQSIAVASCNSNNANVRDDQVTFVQSDLETFFLQALSDVLVGDKLELAEDLTATVTRGPNVKQTFIANPRDIALSILLSWVPSRPGERDMLPFRLIAPDGTEIDTTHVTKRGRNMSFTTIRFPLIHKGVNIKPEGQWTIELIPGNIATSSLNYHLVVLLDNSSIATGYDVKSGDIGTGEAIPIQVRLTDGKKKVRNARVVARIEGPSQGLGDILSTTRTPNNNTQPGRDSVLSPAHARLIALLGDPASASLFKNKSLPTLTLLDNGNSANGDAAAGDGVYSAIFRNTDEEGHYHFAIDVEAKSNPNGPYQRTRRQTVFVRPKPDPLKTDFRLVSITPSGAGVAIRLKAVLKDRRNNLIGPGYLDQVKIVLSATGAAPKVEDNLDGSYDFSFILGSATLNPVISLQVLGKTVISKKLLKLPRLAQ